MLHPLWPTEVSMDTSLNDTHTKIQVNKLDENVWFELITTNGTFNGLVQNANSAQLF